jgi:hypothetical protein
MLSRMLAGIRRSGGLGGRQPVHRDGGGRDCHRCRGQPNETAPGFSGARIWWLLAFAHGIKPPTARQTAAIDIG